MTKPLACVDLPAPERPTDHSVRLPHLYPQHNCLDSEAALRMWSVKVTWFSNEEGRKGGVAQILQLGTRYLA